MKRPDMTVKRMDRYMVVLRFIRDLGFALLIWGVASFTTIVGFHSAWKQEHDHYHAEFRLMMQERGQTLEMADRRYLSDICKVSEMSGTYVMARAGDSYQPGLAGVKAALGIVLMAFACVALSALKVRRNAGISSPV